MEPHNSIMELENCIMKLHNSNYGSPYFLLIERYKSLGSHMIIIELHNSNHAASSYSNYGARKLRYGVTLLRIFPFGTPYNKAKEKQNIISETYMTMNYRF